ncbi:arginine kinase-like [Phymastichus coffea]|uniref:arginine kinase-like n=1 Tax=Phymastichus coffea TaxID=108790 RepID=UPI00273CC7FF|nr:arginine kinase-like [Phymastichus coffea]
MPLQGKKRYHGKPMCLNLKSDKAVRCKSNRDESKSLENEFNAFFLKESDSLMKKYLTCNVFRAIKHRKTKFGSSLFDVIRSGLKNLDSSIGAYASDPCAYDVFADLFNPIIEEYHEGFNADQIHPPTNWGDPTKLPNLDPTNKYVVSTRVRCARSVYDYPFNPKMEKEHYCEIQRKISKALGNLEGDLKGTYQSLVSMDRVTKEKLISQHYLFKEGDRFLQEAGACSFWPAGRGIFYNAEKTLLAWCNEEDHLRLISMQEGSNLAEVYGRLVEAVTCLEKTITFARHERLGYLTFCPTNLGTTIRASVHIKLPNLSADLRQFKCIASTYNLQVRGTQGEHSDSTDGVYDLSNKRRLGLTEWEVLEEMSHGIMELIKREANLEIEIEKSSAGLPSPARKTLSTSSTSAAP